MTGAVTIGRQRRRSPEATIQRAVFAHLRARGARGLVAFHVPNGGYRRPTEAAILQGLGVLGGLVAVAVAGMLAGGILETVDLLRGQIFPLPQIGVARPARRNCPIYDG